MSHTEFSSLKLSAELFNNLASLGFTNMTPIQQQSLPIMLEGKDVIAQAKTGSGKTAAFGLALLEKLDKQHFNIQAIVLCPTRELADQVAQDIRDLARGIGNVKVLTLCGGTPFKPQVSSLEYGAHIIVGTPGRVEDHLRRETLQLKHINTLVLDEADRMLDMGFQSAIDYISSQAAKQRQTLLFSATFPDSIKAIGKRLLKNPTVIEVKVDQKTLSITQQFYEVSDDQNRLHALRLLLLQQQPESAIVFCNTKREAQNVTDELIKDGFDALDLTGDLEQRDRDQTLVQFANRSISVLVATDVAARGLDIDNLDAVFNYHLAHDPESHIHRIGRTGRAGKEGTAYSLFSAKDGYKISLLEDHLQQPIHSMTLPNDDVLQRKPKPAPMQTLNITGGKKQKIRPGDILGALTGENGIDGKYVGKIKVSSQWSYVAVQRQHAQLALKKLNEGKLKGRSFRVRLLKS